MDISKKNEENKFILDIKLFLENFENEEKNKILDKILIKAKNKSIGFKDEKDLKEYLEWAIFGEDKKERFNFKIDQNKEKEIRDICKNTLEKCRDYTNDSITLSIFPVFNTFILENMNGCGGLSPEKNKIVITINFVEGWQQALKKTIGHEFAHAISEFYNGGDYNLGEGFILDGIAEHFREEVVGGDKAPWSNSISYEKAKSIVKKLKNENKLKIKNLNLWQEVFFGSREYPHWAGYSIGYYLIEDYLKSNEKINWKEIIAIHPKEILQESLKNWGLE